MSANETEHAPNFPWSMYATTAFYRLAYNREPKDCGVRALAVACAAPYGRAYTAMRTAGRLNRESATTSMMIDAAQLLGYDMVSIESFGKTLLTAERALKRTRGGYILVTCDHAVGVWNGEIIDHARGELARVEDTFRLERRKTK